MLPFFLHHHTFKNAGSTIDWILERNFGSGWRNIEPLDGKPRLRTGDFSALINREPGLMAISSHQSLLEKVELPERWVFDIAMVRHPIDRLGSVFRHYRKAEDGSHFCDRARSSTFREFVGWLLDELPYMACDTQTSLFGNGGDWFFPPNAAALDRAKNNLAEVKILGTVEAFDLTFVTAEVYARPMFPTVDFSYTTQNVTQTESHSIELRLAALQHECGPELWRWLQDRNRLDLELWKWATAEVNRRASAVYHLEERLYQFRERCRALAQTAPQV